MNYVDDFLCNPSPEEYETSYEDQLWYETECWFCKEMEIEPEVHED